MTDQPTFTFRVCLEVLVSGDQTALQAALLRQATETLDDPALIDQIADQWAAQDPAIALEDIVSRLQIDQQLKRVLSPLHISSAGSGPGWRVEAR
jgi:hypothetical protein